VFGGRRSLAKLKWLLSGAPAGVDGLELDLVTYVRSGVSSLGCRGRESGRSIADLLGVRVTALVTVIVVATAMVGR
jgi:hypothetical protein